MGIFNDNSQNNNTGGSGQPGQPGVPGQKGDPGIGFKLTADGNFNIDGKLLTNVAGPVNGDDATNKNYVDTKNSQQYIAIADKASKSDLNSKLSIDGSNSMNANLNLNNNKIINLKNGTDNGDVVNYRQLIEKTNNHQNNYHLQPSFNFYKNFGDGKILKKANSLTIDPHHKHLGLNYVKKQSFNSGFGGQAWVSLKMTNNLPIGLYTIVFETFAATYIVSHNSVTQQKLNSETLLQQVNGDANYTIINFTHDYQTTHSNAIIQFTSNGKPGEITFEIRYYGPSYNNSTLNFLFFSRVISGRQNTAFNHNLFDVDDVQLVNQILYFDDVNLNSNKIKNVAIPTNNEDVANKKYVDDEIAKLPHSDNGTLKLDGSRAMTGTLDMANHKIINTAAPTDNNDVTNKRYVDDRIKLIPGGASDLLKLDGTLAMTGDLNLGGYSIINIKEPNISDLNYAANVNFVNKTIDNRLKYSVQSSDTSNAFQYVMDDPAGQFYDEDDIKGIKKTNKDYHKINKETYEMQLVLDSSGYYSSRLGINMYTLPNGEYSLVYELYFPNSIDSSTVQISAVSAVETVSKVTTNVFNNHTRSIIHLHKYNNVAPNRLMIDMVLKNKAGVSYANKLTIFVIVYGVSGYVNNVNTSVWDRLFEVINNVIKVESTIDMNKHDIKNVDNLSMNKLIDMNNGQIKDLGDGNENGDAVNVKQLNNVESNMGKYTKAEITKTKAEITKVDTSLKKYFNDHLNNVIAERGYQNSLICVFYLDNNQFNNGDKIANLPDKKSFMPIHDANQSVESRKPTADDDLNFSYMNYRAQQFLTVDYNLNGKNNLNVFIVFRILDSSGAILNGIFGNDNGGNDRYIAVRHDVTPKQLRIGYGNGRLDLYSFPSKANPITLNFSVLSVHYNTPDENNSLVYCNGKYIINFTGETSTGQNAFSIGSISSFPTNTSLKHIAYFSLYHGRFSKKDILIQHKYLCERYKIDHDPITIP